LLKRGAYGAIMEDDDAGSKFCEEDIDQILDRRAHTVTLETGEKNSTFSKVSAMLIRVAWFATNESDFCLFSFAAFAFFPPQLLPFFFRNFCLFSPAFTFAFFTSQHAGQLRLGGGQG